MPLSKITKISGRGVHVAGNDLDTDRIIPARYLKCITFDGLGEFLFMDARKNPDGSEKAHALNDPRFRGASIMLSGANFGCGSSREHAPQAIQKAGFKAVVAEGFAEIFFGNSTAIGLACLTAGRDDIALVAAAIESDPGLEITVDVAAQKLHFGGRSIPASIRDAARDALVNGRWDPIGELIEGVPLVRELAGKLPYLAV